MRRTLAAVLLLGSIGSAAAQDRPTAPVGGRTTPPAASSLATDTSRVLLGDLWRRGGLSLRDRSIVTVAAIIAGGHVDELRSEVERALDDGFTPGELDGEIDHLAYYAGWPVAVAAERVATSVYAARGVERGGPPPEAGRTTVDEAADARRAEGVRSAVGSVSPGLVDFTNGVLFADVWRRSDLKPRDRSLVTISALVATGQTGQLAYHTGFGLRNGLTKEEVGEALTQLAFYAGWPRAFSAVAPVREAFEAAGKP